MGPDPEIGDRYISLVTGAVAEVIGREGVLSTVAGVGHTTKVDVRYSDGMIAKGVNVALVHQFWRPWTEPPLDDPDLLEVWLDG